MSRRFGRKHRRKQASYIALLEHVQRKQAFQLRDEIESVNQIREQLAILWARILDWDEDIRSQLGRYSSWLIETTQIKGRRETLGRLSVYEPMQMAPLDFSATFSPSDVRQMFERMHYFRVELDQVDPMYFRRLLRVRLTGSAEVLPANKKKPPLYRDSEACYGISGEMLRAGLTARDIHTIALDVVRVLVDQLNERNMR